MTTLTLEEAFSRAEIIHNGKNTPKGSHTYMAFGWAIRKKYIQIILALLEKEGYEEWNFSDIISPKDFQIMNDEIMDISKKSMYIDTKNRDGKIEDRQILAPTHEIPIYASLRDHIQYARDLPLKLVHTGSAYRRSKNYAFPFSLGERRSFIEGHGVFENSEQAKNHAEVIQKIMKEIFEDILQMPYIDSIRPLSTNNPISKYTHCQDIILPHFGRTQIAGMTYFHDDIFAKPFGVSYSKIEDNYTIPYTPSGLHFGFSDNLLLGSLVNAFCQQDNRFYLPEALLPYHINIVCEENASKEAIITIKQELDQMNLRYNIAYVEGKSQKRKKYQKLKLQGAPIIIGINANNTISCDIGDIKEQYHKLLIRNIPDITHNALEYRKQKKYNDVLSVYQNTIIYGANLSMGEINQLISQGKIIRIFLTQDDNIVVDFEKQLQHGEVLGFQKTINSGICKHTGQRVDTIAHISKRF